MLFLPRLWKKCIPLRNFGTHSKDKLFYRVESNHKPPNSNPLIVLHGLLGNSSNWKTIAKALSNNSLDICRDVYLLDLRNHGRSPHYPSMDYREMANDVLQVMDSNKIEQATLVGHSMGGKLAMKLATLFPDRVGKLCVVDIAPVAYQNYDGMNIIFEAMQQLNLGLIKTRPEADSILSKKIPDSAVRMFILTNLERNLSSGEYFWRINLNSIVKSYPKLVQDVTTSIYQGKTLFVRGSNSDYILDSHLTFIKKYFPLSQLITVENAGHWVHADQPQRVIELILDFEKTSRE